MSRKHKDEVIELRNQTKTRSADVLSWIAGNIEIFVKGKKILNFSGSENLANLTIMYRVYQGDPLSSLKSMVKQVPERLELPNVLWESDYCIVLMKPVKAVGGKAVTYH